MSQQSRAVGETHAPAANAAANDTTRSALSAAQRLTGGRRPRFPICWLVYMRTFEALSTAQPTEKG